MTENNSQEKQIQDMLEFILDENSDSLDSDDSESTILFWVNEIENAVDSIETATLFLERTDNYKWKWISFALHHALYSFCIVSLVQGNYEVVLKSHDNDSNCFFRKGTEEKWKKSNKVRIDNGPYYIIEWKAIEGKPPKIRSKSKRNKKQKKQLIGFWSALARVQDQEFWMGRLYGIKALKLTESQRKNIEWLVLDVRNDLMHFVPKSYGISIEDLKAALNDIIQVIEFLAFESNAVHFSIKPDLESRLKKTLKKFKEKIST